MAFRKINPSGGFPDSFSGPFPAAGLPYTTRTGPQRDQGVLKIEDTTAALDQLQSILGPDGLSRDGTDRLVLSPGSIDDLQKLVGFAGGHSIPLSLRHFTGPDAPPHPTRLSLQRLNRIIEIDPENLTARVESGVPHDALSDALAEFGLVWPVAPLPGHDTLADSYLSGLALGNSGLFPDLRHWVLGATLVSRDGLSFRAGGRTIKNSSGYDLTRAAAGAAGLFGIPAELQLRLERRLVLERVAYLPLASDDAAAAILSVATANLDLVLRLTFASTTTGPPTARLALAGRSEAITSLWSRIERQFPLSEDDVDDVEDAALAACAAAADSLLCWNAGPHACMAVTSDLRHHRPPLTATVVALPLQRRGFVTGPDPDRIAVVISAAGGSPIRLPDGFAGFTPSDLLGPASRPFAAFLPPS